VANPQAVAALVVALAGLAGCKSGDIGSGLHALVGEHDSIAVLTGDVQAPSAGTIGEPSSVAYTPPPASSSEECVTIFRIQTCEAGVLHHLNEDFSWRD